MYLTLTKLDAAINAALCCRQNARGYADEEVEFRNLIDVPRTAGPRNNCYSDGVIAISQLIAEIENAMSGPPTGDGWSCFVSNKRLSALQDTEPELLAAIEEVVRRFRFEEAHWFSDGNLLRLLLIYFEKADDGGVDISGFVRSLSGRHLEEALRAIFQIWGPTRGRARRRVIAEPLYAA